MRRFQSLGLFLSLLAPSLQAAERPNVIIITLDTVRADRMGFLGSTRGLTPNLDALARQGIVFEQAYSQAPLTPVSHATIFTGTYPPFHKVHDFGNRLGPDLPFLPALLHAGGYRTAAFVSSIILDPKNGFAPGFERGFDVFDAGFHRRQLSEKRDHSVLRHASDTVARALKWLEGNKDGQFFLWIHLWDAHDPYDPPAPYKARYPNAPYDAEIAYLDAALGKLLSSLRTMGLFDSALIAVMSDHGESLGDHGEKTHGIFLYDATIHVPLLFKLPGGAQAGKRTKVRAGLVDVAPSILDALQQPLPPAMQGQSLLRLLALTPVPNRPSYAETEYPRRAFGWSRMKALRTENYLFVQAPQQELYDVSADPGAKQNLAEKTKVVAARISSQIDEFVKRTSANAPQSAETTLDPKEMEKLTALGYVASRRNITSGNGSIDPKTRIQVANDLHDANLAIEDGRGNDVIPLLERVVAGDPKIQTAQLFLGVAYTRQKNYAKALGPLRKAIELQPEAMLAQYEIGLVLFETGDWKTAATHFEICVNHNPEWEDARFSLASVYARIDRVPDAMANLVLVLDKNPDHYRANLLLGRLLTLKGQADLGVPYLEKAAQVQPDSLDAHSFLADAYAKLGRLADAERERARADQLKRSRKP